MARKFPSLRFYASLYFVLFIFPTIFRPTDAKARPGRDEFLNNIAKTLASLKDVVASQSERDEQMINTLKSIEETNRMLVEKLTRTSGDGKELPLVLCQDINSLTSSMQKSSQRANNMMETLHDRLKVFEDKLSHMGISVEDEKKPTEAPSTPDKVTSTTLPQTTTVTSPLVPCSLPYKRVGRDCLYFPKERKTWGEAKQHCRRYGGDLAVPSDIHKDEYKLRPWPDYLKIEEEKNLPVISYLHRQISDMKIRNAYVLMGARDLDKDGDLEWTSGRKVQMVSNYIDDTKGFCYYIYMNADGTYRALAHFCSFVEYFFCQQFTSIEI
ncbi:uncharacterized protein LOC143023296 [Oratosquilla oratoria]|uniref:uncharacterized protein LOC143023296 n=1 Tax=Oratosquilla oratoria TaxID=337810 RepID=UPI003F75CA61